MRRIAAAAGAVALAGLTSHAFAADYEKAVADSVQVYCLDNNYIPLFASNKWVASLDADIKPAYCFANRC